MAGIFIPCYAENFKGIRLIQVGLEDSACLTQTTFDNRLVSLLSIIPARLKDFFGLRSLGKNHQPRCFTVKSVNDPDSLFRHRIAMSDMLRKLEVGRLFLLGLAGNAQEIRRLIDHNDVCILKKNTDTRSHHRSR